jgi:selenocysteine lyase/cysteine desulfurase
LLIVRRKAYQFKLHPSFPGGGTVKFVTGYSENNISFSNDPFEREISGTPNVVGFYRVALAFELQDMIGLELIKAREIQNA